MWTREVTIKTNASQEQIWALWTDVEHWNIWDEGVEFSKLNGEFQVGTSGILKPHNAPKSKFEIISVQELKEFTTRSSLPFAKMDFIHEMHQENGELHITHQIQITGFLTFLFSRVIGEKLIKELPIAMKNLSEKALSSK